MTMMLPRRFFLLPILIFLLPLVAHHYFITLTEDRIKSNDQSKKAWSNLWNEYNEKRKLFRRKRGYREVSPGSDSSSGSLPAKRFRRKKGNRGRPRPRPATPQPTPAPTTPQPTPAPTTPLPTPAPTPPAPAKLVNIGTLQSDAEVDGFGGYSLSISDKGDLVAVGSPFYSPEGLDVAGLVQIFQYQTGTTWQQVGPNLVGEENGAAAGVAVSVSGNGQRIAYGVPGASASDGLVKIVEIETGIGTDLEADEPVFLFGSFVSLSQNGQRIAIASSRGVRIFEFGDFWEQLGDTIPTNVSDSILLALSADGNIVVISDFDEGTVRIFEWDDNQWDQLGETLTVENDDEGFAFETSIDVSKNGKRVVVGTPVGNYVEVFEYDDEWKLVGEKITGDLADCFEEDCAFGYSVSISDDGNGIIIGSPVFSSEEREGRGRARVYRYDNLEWKQVGNDVLGENEGDTAGFVVSMSGDGDHVAIGVPRLGDLGKGVVFVYKIE